MIGVIPHFAFSVVLSAIAVKNSYEISLAVASLVYALIFLILSGILLILIYILDPAF